MAYVQFHGLRSLQVSSHESIFNPISRHTSNSRYFAIKACIMKPDQDIHLESKIIYLGKPDGPTCHTGSETCYYISIFDSLNKPQIEENNLALTTLYSLESTLARRKEEPSAPEQGVYHGQSVYCLTTSYCAQRSVKKRTNFAEHWKRMKTNHGLYQRWQTLYHEMVLLIRRGLKFEDVLEVLRCRFIQSGIDEKNSRKAKSVK